MRKALTSLITLSLVPALYSEPTSANLVPQKEVTVKIAPSTPPQVLKPSSAKTEHAKLTLENALADERQKKATAKLRAEVARLKLEKEALAEKLALEALKLQAGNQDEVQNFASEKARLTREAEVAKLKADLLTDQLKATQAQASLATTELKAQIEEYKIRRQRDSYADSKPQYLDNPLQADGTLVISDRRISLNGAITPTTADQITERINYYNNKDGKKPIFIVIDDSPGGSVMAGYRILKAMEGSSAPIHVVVKSFAASMAAGITTLAKESYAYPNAIILHHQISNTIMMAKLNLTEQKEFYEDSQRWWERLAQPIADKMGISTDQFIKDMYAKSSSGDWMEFADEAQKLKWVNHVVTRIQETSLLTNPDRKETKNEDEKSATAAAQIQHDKNGQPVHYLPRLNPKDVYFLYNPDNYYRLR